MDVDAAGGLEVLAASEAALEEAASLGTRGEKDAGEKDGEPRDSRGHDERCGHEAHGHDAHGHLHAPGGFGSFSFLPGRTFSEEDVDLLLEGLRRVRSGRVLRAKGFLARKDGCGLEHVELAAGGAGHERSAYRGDPKLVVIGRGLDGDELARVVGARPQP